MSSGRWITLAACVLNLSVASGERFRVDHHDKITVTGSGYDGQGPEFCRQFRLTPEQVKRFFNAARPTTERDIHDNYEWLPCYVDGTIEKKGKLYRWRIRPVGIGVLKTDGQPDTFFGCHSCDDSY